MTSTPFPVEKTWFYFSLLPQILRAYFASKVLPNFTIKIAVSKGSEATEVWVPAQTSGAQAPFFGGLLGLLARSALRATPPQFALRAGCRFFPKTKVLLNFFQKIAGSRGSETASVWFQTKLTGAKRLPRGCSGFQARSAAYAATPLRAVLRARGQRPLPAGPTPAGWANSSVP